MIHKLEITTMEALILTHALSYWMEESNGHPEDKKICKSICSRTNKQVSRDLSGRDKK